MLSFSKIKCIPSKHETTVLEQNVRRSVILPPLLLSNVSADRISAMRLSSLSLLDVRKILRKSLRSVRVSITVGVLMTEFKET